MATHKLEDHGDGLSDLSAGGERTLQARGQAYIVSLDAGPHLAGRVGVSPKVVRMCWEGGGWGGPSSLRSRQSDANVPRADPIKF